MPQTASIHWPHEIILLSGDWLCHVVLLNDDGGDIQRLPGEAPLRRDCCRDLSTAVETHCAGRFRAWRGAPCNRPPVTRLHPGKNTGTGGRRLVGRVAIEGMEEGQSFSTWENWRPDGSPLGERLARGE